MNAGIEGCTSDSGFQPLKIRLLLLCIIMNFVILVSFSLSFQVPTVRSWLSGNQSSDYRYIDCKIGDDILQTAIAKLKIVAARNFEEPNKHLAWFSEYMEADFSFVKNAVNDCQ